MYRKFPKKHGRTFKYHLWTTRSARRWYKSSRFCKAHSGKSTAKVYLNQMTMVLHLEDFEKIEAKMYSRITPYTFNGWYD